MSTRSTPSRRTAFTLVEAMLSVMIVGMILVVALSTVGASARMRLVQANRHHGHTLVQDLVSEILTLPYEDPSAADALPGPESGEPTSTRDGWDDIDDFHGWTSSPPRRPDGTPMTEFAGWTRAVSVTYAPSVDPTGSAGADQGIKRVYVVAIDPTGRVTSSTSLRSRSGIVDRPVEVETDVATRLGVELDLGDGTVTSLVSGAPLLNLPSSTDINLLVNGGAERGTDGWNGFTGADVAEFTADAHGGNGSIIVINRDTIYSGGGQYVTNVVQPGVTYDIEAWVATGNWETFRYRFTTMTSPTGDLGTASENWITFGITTASPGEWTRLAATFTPSWTDELIEARIEIETTDTTAAFIFDDALMLEAP